MRSVEEVIALDRRLDQRLARRGGTSSERRVVRQRRGRVLHRASRLRPVPRTEGGRITAPATGKRVGGHFAADCISQDNLIHTEWLVRDNGARVRQLGLDIDVVARDLAQIPRREAFVISPPTRMIGQTPRGPLDIPTGTPDGYIRTMFHEIWNRRRLDRLGEYYDDEVAVHSGGGRVARGLRNLSHPAHPNDDGDPRRRDARRSRLLVGRDRRRDPRRALDPRRVHAERWHPRRGGPLRAARSR